MPADYSTWAPEYSGKPPKDGGGDFSPSTPPTGGASTPTTGTGGGSGITEAAPPAGWFEVTWKECSGYDQTPQVAFVLGTIKAGTLYLASTPEGLDTLTGDTTTPKFKPNSVGDGFTCPIPQFFGGTIDYLGLFQDRLVIGSGASLLMSRNGDYFNWFRQSLLTLEDNDPWEGYALGAEDDTIRFSTSYDRNLVLHGDKKWYQVNGRQTFTPKNAFVTVGSAYKNTTGTEPQVSGNYTFYCKHAGIPGKRSATVHQVQAGVVTDSPESFEISQQLDKYLRGKPSQIKAFSSPNMVLLRTDTYRNGLYTYAYLDAAAGEKRLFDSWSRWEWDPQVGYSIGLSADEEVPLLYMLKHGLNKDGVHNIWISVEQFQLTSELSDYPYMDSLRPASSVLSPTSASYITSAASVANMAIAFDSSTDKFLVGSQLAQLSSFVGAYADVSAAWAGITFSSYVQPTNPFVQDRQGQPILSGRLTLGSVLVSVADTAGVKGSVSNGSLAEVNLDFNGRILGQSTDVIGRQPIATTKLPLFVGKEVRETSYVLSSKTWLPFTVTSLEWVGQFFNRVRRI